MAETEKKVRVRFAPSPTGGLHLGGMRTALFNYLFAKQHQGDFIVRIEDTDQTRFVPGAEEYIFQCLKWCGIEPVEGPGYGGPFAPYRQSERKEIYSSYANRLVEKGVAYYAFDTPEELEQMRKNFKTPENPSPTYNHITRGKMKNSLTLPEEAVRELLSQKTPYVIRIKMPASGEISFTDMIRGEVKFDAAVVDDKVLLKADGMPTYHLAVVVDDQLMQISHVFRGEEWLSSAPLHIVLWKELFGLDQMPAFAHLPLILKPDGNGKLSKRDGERLGFPVFAMSWTDHKTGEHIKGFNEIGFLPQAFINMLAMLGWNDATDQELFSLDELVKRFSLERVHKAGAKFDFEKAKWFNHQWVVRLSADELLPAVKSTFLKAGIEIPDDAILLKVIALVKDRCTLIPDFIEQAGFFFRRPEADLSLIRNKWNENKSGFFPEWIRAMELMPGFKAEELENTFKEMAAAKQIKPGELLMPLRVMLVGGKFGPGVFEIAEVIGKEETIKRVRAALARLQ